MNSSDLRILVYVDVFSELSETFIYNHLVGLQKKGVSLIIACNERKNDGLRPFPNVAIISTTSFEKKLKTLSSKLFINGFTISGRLHFSKIISSFKPNVIQCHFGDQSLNILDNIKITIPIIITFHGYDASYMLYKCRSYQIRMRKLLAKQLVYPVFVSQALLSNMSNFGIFSDNSTVIHYGVQFKEFLEQDRFANDKYIIQVSRLSEKKGHIYTLRALQLLKEKNGQLNFKFIVAGDGPLRNTLETFCIQNNLCDDVEFIGWVNSERRDLLLQCAQAFVQHSIVDSNHNMEGFPNAILEAMMYKLPILTTFHSGIPEMVEHETNGLLSKEKDIESFAINLQQIMTWDKSEINRKKVISQYNFDSYISKYIHLYTTALSKDN